MRVKERPVRYSGTVDDPGDSSINTEQWHVDRLADVGYYDEWLREV